MSQNELITLLLIGLAAGWLAARVVGGTSWLVYLISGVLGALLAQYATVALGLRVQVFNPAVTQVISATVGAIILLSIWRIIARARS